MGVKKTGFWGKIFGGNKTGSCCAVELEDIPKAESHQKEEKPVKHSEKSEKKGSG